MRLGQNPVALNMVVPNIVLIERENALLKEDLKRMKSHGLMEQPCALRSLQVFKGKRRLHF